MKKSINKIAALAIAMTMAAGLIAGCSTKNSESTDSDKSVTQEGSNETVSSDDYSQPLPEDYEGTLTMWGWDDPYYKAVTDAFMKKYPNVKFEYTPMANGDTLQKYQTALATGTELPDVAWSIIDSRAKVFELDMWEDLSQAPYNFDISEVYEYLHPKMVNSKGQVCGIEQSLCPAGIAYRKDLAKEYFGTDDPKELEKMFPDWKSFIAKGQEVYEKSGGTIYMWPGLADAQQFIREQGGKTWIDGTVIKVTENFQRSLNLTCEFRDTNIVDKLEAWTPAWYASFGEGKHIFAGCATWSVPFTIEPNDPEGETTGHWGLMNAPEGNISWGGTTLGISKTCKDKRLAWEFIRFATLSTEGAKALNSIGLLTSAIKPYEEAPELKSFKSKWFGDQDLGAYFLDEIIPNIKSRNMNLDDNVVHETLNLISTTLNNDRNMTADQAMEKLKEELEMKLPDYTVE
jgi:multiple sugar transport system substrate-binding protein